MPLGCYPSDKEASPIHSSPELAIAFVQNLFYSIRECRLSMLDPFSCICLFLIRKRPTDGESNPGLQCAPLCSESGVKLGLAAVHTLQFLKSKALHSKNVHLT